MASLRVEDLEGRDLMSAGVAVGFTPPLGSDKGSIVAEPTSAIMSDGLGTTFPAASTTGAGNEQGIIAILIG